MNESDKPYQQKARKVPAGRLRRLASFGGLASSIAGNVLKDAGKQVLSGGKPSISNSVLTQSNAHSLTDKLANMRGAAMKVGQLLAMDAGDILPKQWEPILARLRQQADSMPKSQLLAALNNAWGQDWHDKFSYFSFEPIAAASIGQVHKATLIDGLQVAVKVQYPGVKQSIDSDIDNVMTLIKLSGALPKHIDIAPLMAKAKLQLHEEADYLAEAQHMRQYAKMLAHQPHFEVPTVVSELTTDCVLCMSFLEGQAIESMTHTKHIDVVINTLFELTLQELFDYKMIQSDPNFANYLVDINSVNSSQIGMLKLLDFGATRTICDKTSAQFLAMAKAMQERDRASMQISLQALHLIDENMPLSTIEVILDACELAAECLQTSQYNFKQHNLIKRIQECTVSLMQNKDATATPDFDVALVNRKVTGMVLLANRLGATVDLKTMLARHL